MTTLTAPRHVGVTGRHPTLLLPLFVCYGLLYLVPLLNVFWMSLHSPTGVDVSGYVRFFTEPFYLRILLRTIKLAALATLAAAVLGYPLGFLLARSRGIVRLLLTYAVLAPLLLSGVVRSFGWMVVLGSDGPVSRALRAIGVIDAPLHVLFSEPAIVIGLTHLFMPFTVIAVAGSVQQMNQRVVQAARSLGASGISLFGRVILPLTMPGLLSGSLLVFSLAASAFVTPAILGGARVPLASYLIYQKGVLLNDWQFSASISTVLLVMVALISGASLFLTRGQSRRSQ